MGRSIVKCTAKCSEVQGSEVLVKKSEEHCAIQKKNAVEFSDGEVL